MVAWHVGATLTTCLMMIWRYILSMLSLGSIVHSMMMLLNRLLTSMWLLRRIRSYFRRIWYPDLVHVLSRGSSLRISGTLRNVGNARVCPEMMLMMCWVRLLRGMHMTMMTRHLLSLLLSIRVPSLGVWMGLDPATTTTIILWMQMCWISATVAGIVVLWRMLLLMIWLLIAIVHV